MGGSECDTSSVKVGIGEAQCVSKYVCEREEEAGGWGGGGGLQGQIVHGVHPS